MTMPSSARLQVHLYSAGAARVWIEQCLSASAWVGLANYTAGFSRAYLRHLTLAGEILSCTLLTIHNLHFYLDLMAQARAHLEAGDYGPWHRAWIGRYEAGAAARKA